MKNIYTNISVRIVLLFVTAMIFSYFGEQLHPLLGDWYCSGSGELIKDTYHYEFCNYADCDFHTPTWHWGYRHWLFLTMGICLFIVQVINIIILIDKKTKK